MFLNPDIPANCALRLTRTALLGGIAAAVLLAGCAGPSSQRGDKARDSGAISAAAASPASPLSCLPVAPACPAVPQATDAVTRMLAYAQRVRLMPPAELNQEVTRLGNGSSPTEQLQLSLVLSQLLQLPELIRAQELLGRVLADAGAEAQSLHTLARLLASRYVELRRVEEQLEKQTQQTRDVQRRLDQTNERLEALKAIERSLPSRPPAANSSAPAGRGTHAPTP